MENFIEISFTFLLTIVFLYYYFHDKTGLPTNWPVVGMLPGVFKNLHRPNEFFTELVEKSKMNFIFKGPWLSTMHTVLATVDPSNIHYIMSKNFGNYPKGSEFKEIFDVLGDGIFNVDSHMWEYHRKMAQSFLGRPNFHHFLVKKALDKIDNGLKPVLDNVCSRGLEVDMQDLFGRFTFDTICTIIMDFDPKSLLINLPSVPPADALDDLEEVILYRHVTHVTPPFIWKFMRWLDVGYEKTHNKACKILDDFIYKCIATKRSQTTTENEVGHSDDLLTLYMKQIDKINSISNKNIKNIDKFLRDTILNYFIAGRDTTSATLSWFFYLLTKNQHVETKIRQELERVIDKTQNQFETNSRELCTKLVYLHATLCETLRLYPPVAFEAKIPAAADTLPSGHQLSPNTRILFGMYAMGRMKSIWGDDCYVFKPERWITSNGKIKHEPSYKFFAFNAGPRTCAGKDMAFTQMKIVAATILKNYRIEAVDEVPAVPDVSIILHMKHGFKVKVFGLDK